MKNAPYQQLNVRIDASLKRQAEDVLALMGSSATELVRAVYEKVARGAEDYTETMNVLKSAGTGAGNVETQQGENPVEAGWAIAREFYGAAGCDPESLGPDERTWGEIYEEALAAHFEEKGILQ